MIARLVFIDDAGRRRLNAATHLPVAMEIVRQLISCWLRMRLVVVMDMPLLFETGSHKLTRPRVLVAADPDHQLRRLKERDGSSEADARARMAAQMPLEAKARLADVVLDNNGSLEALERQVDQLARRLRRGALLPGLLTSPCALMLCLAAAWSWGPRLLTALFK
ncbi:dephospho-CoA kinase [Monoraphidium neglectum]|uniref:Dephospho-CoA kinase n=1 Tax=Monoraphidium neglectum TaxID=145388 RepID=A0A0D2NUH4_9CHLO|nr:dephospho-CoA kinase [Monoraphidium neglectum]KIZ07746.1 dephospho-CoA kinase [Monoraphidium neglectum]|eukprot:XP_013906765.1 dephospho-CoA kinase [Monoraphidium neglectum]